MRWWWKRRRREQKIEDQSTVDIINVGQEPLSDWVREALAEKTAERLTNRRLADRWR